MIPLIIFICLTAKFRDFFGKYYDKSIYQAILNKGFKINPTFYLLEFFIT